MEEFIGKQCHIFINFNNKPLFYAGVITAISDGHIYFTDKYGYKFCWSKNLVCELKEATRCQEEGQKNI